MLFNFLAIQPQSQQISEPHFYLIFFHKNNLSSRKACIIQTSLPHLLVKNKPDSLCCIIIKY
jgi:hypothetical protein